MEFLTDLYRFLMLFYNVLYIYTNVLEPARTSQNQPEPARTTYLVYKPRNQV